MSMKAESKFNKNDNKYALPTWRFKVVYGFIIVAIFGLVVNFAILQIVKPEKLINEGDKRSIRHQEMVVPRASITDRNGRPLAVSVPMIDVWVDPKVVRENGGIEVTDIKWQELANSLGLSVGNLASKINNSSQRFVYLARQVTPEIADYLKKLKLVGLNYDRSSKRYYPSGDVVAQLIGFTDIDSNGSEGLERSYNSWLTGESGQRIVRRDRFGRVIEDIDMVEGEMAPDLVLSIDERLQNLVFKELSSAVEFNKADSGTAVLVDVHTGEIIAMASSPSYNPNNRLKIDPSLLRNKAITDAFEPGSTVKPLIVMAALENKVADESTIIDTRPFYVNRYEIKDVSPQRQLNLAGILAKSSNIGVSKLALQMDPHTVVDFYARFGLGQSTELGIGGESKGTIAANRTRWADIERATFAFGYGLTVTPLQLARAYAAIGNYGVYRPVSIMKVNEPVMGTRIVSEKIARTVVTMMEAVAEANAARAGIPEYSSAIKTGTAKKLSATGTYINQYIAYTAGIAPASQPRYSLVVIIDNPKAGQYYGGAVSAPVFGKIMGGVLRTMNVVPDRPLPNNTIKVN